MKTQNLTTSEQAKNQRNKALAIYIASISTFVVTYSVFTVIQYL